MKPGAALAARRILETIDLEAPPQRLSDILSEMAIVERWPGDPYEFAERWEVGVRNVLLLHWQNALEESRLPRIAFNSSSDYMIQGACFIEPSDPLPVRLLKHRRLRAKDHHQAIRLLRMEEFELLCVRLLRLVGIREARLTRMTRDEGIDFFGQLWLGDLGKEKPAFPGPESLYQIWVIGQANRYHLTKVGTSDLRELIGSVEMLRASAFGSSQPDAQYTSAAVRRYDPVAIMLMTTGIVSSDSWRLARQSGIILIDGEMISAFLAERGIGESHRRGEKCFSPDSFQQWLYGDN